MEALLRSLTDIDRIVKGQGFIEDQFTA
jgi:2-dehydro-3-deoxyphosphooctonate aldolase (KDO 8-P synthase)